MKCSDCRFWYKAEEQYIYGQCHRRAPHQELTVTARPAGTYERVEITLQTSPHPHWPNTHETDWCGDFAANL